MDGLNEAFGVPSAQAQEFEPEEEETREEIELRDENRLEPFQEPTLEQLARLAQFRDADKILRTIDANNPALQSMSVPGYIPTQAHIDELKAATRQALGLPEDWLDRPTDKEDGWEFINPNNAQDRIRVMAGNSTGSFPARRNPYVQDQINGRILRANGTRQQGGNVPEAHYPLKDYKFRREK